MKSLKHRGLVFSLGILFLIIPEALRFYLIMPLPGSQDLEGVGLAHFLHVYRNEFRALGGLLVLISLISYWLSGTLAQRLVTLGLLLVYGAVFYATNFKFSAEHMFLEPKQKIFLPAEANSVEPDKLVIGLILNGEAKAYPIQFIGYHHMVQDTVGDTPVYITYCTVCRSGRAYYQFLKGEHIRFRLRGMDHYNAMFEDVNTTSWWSQETGKAIAGKMKGTQLEEIPSRQMTLAAWLRLYPNSLVLQPDPEFASSYKLLRKYDYGLSKNPLEYTDSISWLPHSWVVGVKSGSQSKVYDWNDLEKFRLINDTIGRLPLVLILEDDGISFHAYERQLENETLWFAWNDSLKALRDAQTGSTWNTAGTCIDGLLKGNQLKVLPAYQEFWHSWQTFQPGSTVYQVPK